MAKACSETIHGRLRSRGFRAGGFRFGGLRFGGFRGRGWHSGFSGCAGSGRLTRKEFKGSWGFGSRALRSRL